MVSVRKMFPYGGLIARISPRSVYMSFWVLLLVLLSPDTLPYLIDSIESYGLPASLLVWGSDARQRACTTQPGLSFQEVTLTE